ncbi:toll/interleukin-1 receptor domain-containing protein [Magnetospirillum sp. SS-4]|uniref:toll/interleukin-1 receptor domain-containing protein n=1 Tax=Magnetospirillum sp. SS-4 TaxID=2681465 RepID=UPI001381006E|nr:toll/interleukin-1 receptor domain-containing protein [Magnetospirillum sp. SS-4]CAA7615188.1 conserved hypothetical protein [Magnetospirillum sp. SS-4]
MSAIYYLGFLGQPADHVEAKLRKTLGRMVGEFALTLGVEVGLSGAAFTPKPGMAAAALYFGFPGAKDTPELTRLVRQEVPIIPVVSGLTQFGVETPPGLRHLNGLDLDSQDEDYTGLAAALLECVGLLPRRRRVFVSYRRTESRMAAVQLFEELSARKFDVFLDTHDVLAGKKFQEELWHRLSDSDVVVMLHTPDYFTSSWTAQEFFRALGKRISILRVEWPATMVAPKVAMATATAMKLAAHDLTMTGELSSDALTAICSQVESVRSKSIAIRQSYLAGWIKSEVEAIQGVVEGVGPHRSTVIRLSGGTKVLAFTSLGIPTAECLHQAAINSEDGVNGAHALVYDTKGCPPRVLEHLKWLGAHIPVVRCIAAHELNWVLPDWEAPTQ